KKITPLAYVLRILIADFACLACEQIPAITSYDPHGALHAQCKREKKIKTGGRLWLIKIWLLKKSD
ncbi:MAG TPA: hypothetical protein VF977_04830, partial [Candidatus Binatia bacterium]